MSDPDALPGCVGAASARLVDVVGRGVVVVVVVVVGSAAVARKAMTRSAELTRR
jgi:hypothetical protein